MRKSARWWSLLLGVPFVGVLWMPWYNRLLPAAGGFPFFYLWQFGWIIATPLLIWIVHRRWRA